MNTCRKTASAQRSCHTVSKKWPDIGKLTAPVKAYWPDRALLTVHDGLLLRGSRLVIPTVMRNSVLEVIHKGNQGVSRCRERAREAVWWPGLSSQLNELVRNCKTCTKERANPVEPLMAGELPQRPWQKVGSDLFSLNHDIYLLVVDYYSRFVEIAKLTPTRSQDIIVHLKLILANFFFR